MFRRPLGFERRHALARGAIDELLGLCFERRQPPRHLVDGGERDGAAGDDVGEESGVARNRKRQRRHRGLGRRAIGLAARRQRQLDPLAGKQNGVHQVRQHYLVRYSHHVWREKSSTL